MYSSIKTLTAAQVRDVRHKAVEYLDHRTGSETFLVYHPCWRIHKHVCCKSEEPLVLKTWAGNYRILDSAYDYFYTSYTYCSLPSLSCPSQLRSSHPPLVYSDLIGNFLPLRTLSMMTPTEPGSGSVRRSVIAIPPQTSSHTLVGYCMDTIDSLPFHGLAMITVNPYQAGNQHSERPKAIRQGFLKKTSSTKWLLAVRKVLISCSTAIFRRSCCRHVPNLRAASSVPLDCKKRLADSVIRC